MQGAGRALGPPQNVMSWHVATRRSPPLLMRSAVPAVHYGLSDASLAVAGLRRASTSNQKCLQWPSMHFFLQPANLADSLLHIPFRWCHAAFMLNDGVGTLNSSENVLDVFMGILYQLLNGPLVQSFSDLGTISRIMNEQYRYLNIFLLLIFVCFYTTGQTF